MLICERRGCFAERRIKHVGRKGTDRYAEIRRLENHMLYSDFPFAIFFGNYKADTPNSVKVHSHDYCEIEIMLNGSADHFFEESNYPLVPGDTFIINKGVNHGTGKYST